MTYQEIPYICKGKNIKDCHAVIECPIEVDETERDDFEPGNELLYPDRSEDVREIR